MMKRLFLAVLVCYSFAGFSNTTEDTLSYKLESPYKALKTFINNIEDNNRDLETAALIFNHADLTLEEKIDYVIKYQQVIEGAGILISFDNIPRSLNHFDSVSNEHRYIIDKQYPEIYLQKKDGKWQFQPSILNQINAAHKQLYKFGTDVIISKELKETTLSPVFLGLKLWQWLGILILTVCSVLIRFVFSVIFEKLLSRALIRLGFKNLGEKYLVPVARPLGMILVFILISLLYPILQLPGSIGFYIVKTIKALIPIYATVAIFRLINVVEIYLLKFVSKTESTLDDQLVPLVTKVLKFFIILMGCLIVLDSMNIPIIPLLTGLSIGGLAFALAAQDTIKNFFGSLMIFVDKPFQIGDWIVSENIDGTVEEVGFRSTRIRTFKNSLISVPNGYLADTTIDNYGLRQYRRFKTSIAITYDTPPDRIEVFVDGLKRIVMNHPSTHKQNLEIHLNNMGDTSLDVLFYIFFEASTWSDELKFRQDIILSILRLGKALSVNFAFPTQTVHIENLPGQESLSPEYTLTKDDLNQRLDNFIKP